MLERVIREYGDLLDRVAWGYSDNAHDLEDLMQEILMALWRALPGFRGDSSERTFVARGRPLLSNRKAIRALRPRKRGKNFVDRAEGQP
jgi:DNA-directed RNA polymerase specialized sigma24 family protein